MAENQGIEENAFNQLFVDSSLLFFAHSKKIGLLPATVTAAFSLEDVFTNRRNNADARFLVLPTVPVVTRTDNSHKIADGTRRPVFVYNEADTRDGLEPNMLPLVPYCEKYPNQQNTICCQHLVWLHKFVFPREHRLAGEISPFDVFTLTAAEVEQTSRELFIVRKHAKLKEACTRLDKVSKDKRDITVFLAELEDLANDAEIQPKSGIDTPITDHHWKDCFDSWKNGASLATAMFPRKVADMTVIYWQLAAFLYEASFYSPSFQTPRFCAFYLTLGAFTLATGKKISDYSGIGFNPQVLQNFTQGFKGVIRMNDEDTQFLITTRESELEPQVALAMGHDCVQVALKALLVLKCAVRYENTPSQYRDPGLQLLCSENASAAITADEAERAYKMQHCRSEYTNEQGLVSAASGVDILPSDLVKLTKRRNLEEIFSAGGGGERDWSKTSRCYNNLEVIAAKFCAALFDGETGNRHNFDQFLEEDAVTGAGNALDVYALTRLDCASKELFDYVCETVKKYSCMCGKNGQVYVGFQTVKSVFEFGKQPTLQYGRPVFLQAANSEAGVTFLDLNTRLDAETMVVRDEKRNSSTISWKRLCFYLFESDILFPTRFAKTVTWATLVVTEYVMVLYHPSYSGTLFEFLDPEKREQDFTFSDRVVITRVNPTSPGEKLHDIEQTFDVQSSENKQVDSPAAIPGGNFFKVRAQADFTPNSGNDFYDVFEKNASSVITQMLRVLDTAAYKLGGQQFQIARNTSQQNKVPLDVFFLEEAEFRKCFDSACKERDAPSTAPTDGKSQRGQKPAAEFNRTAAAEVEAAEVAQKFARFAQNDPVVISRHTENADIARAVAECPVDKTEVFAPLRGLAEDWMRRLHENPDATRTLGGAIDFIALRVKKHLDQYKKKFSDFFLTAVDCYSKLIGFDFDNVNYNRLISQTLVGNYLTKCPTEDGLAGDAILGLSHVVTTLKQNALYAAFCAQLLRKLKQMAATLSRSGKFDIRVKTIMGLLYPKNDADNWHETIQTAIGPFFFVPEVRRQVDGLYRTLNDNEAPFHADSVAFSTFQDALKIFYFGVQTDDAAIQKHVLYMYRGKVADTALCFVEATNEKIEAFARHVYFSSTEASTS